MGFEQARKLCNKVTHRKLNSKVFFFLAGENIKVAERDDVTWQNFQNGLTHSQCYRLNYGAKIVCVLACKTTACVCDY